MNAKTPAEAWNVLFSQSNQILEIITKHTNEEIDKKLK